MILPVPSASLSISSHSMTCKLQKSVPSLATESGTSVWRQKSRLPRSFTSSRPGSIAVAKEKNLASQTFAIFDHFFGHASIITGIQWLDAKQILAKNCVP